MSAALPPEYRDRIVCGDVLDVLRKLPDECIDLVVTSPPYNLRRSVSPLRGSRIWRNPALAQGYDGHSDNLPHKEYVAWQRAVLSELLRLIPDNGAIFYNHKWRVQRGRLQERHDIVG